MTAQPAFPGMPDVAHPEPVEKLSATRRLTLANAAQFARGVHPATLHPLANNGQSCGGCAYHQAVHHHNGTYHKCVTHRLGMSHGASSDIRVSWPACTLWATS